jgi:hypothetical protein
VWTNNRFELPAQALWNVLFYKNAACGDKCRKYLRGCKGYLLRIVKKQALLGNFNHPIFYFHSNIGVSK